MLYQEIEKKGWKAQTVPAYRVKDLIDAIMGLYDKGLIDHEFYMDQLESFSYKIPSGWNEKSSIIIIAVPTPQMRIFFHLKGKRIPVIIPPTYVSYTNRTVKTQELISGWLSMKGYNCAETNLPLKTLAVCSGLASYGRNNICYVEGLGSFLQLAAVFTDMPFSNDPWGKPEMLQRCKSCVACIRACPTGTITRERFLVHAETCLTYYNESRNDFPEWIDASWHNSLVGCMKCQAVCPENRNVIGWIEDRGEFGEAETENLITNVPFEELSNKTAGKLRSLEINEDYGALCRNLKMLIDS
jgi:epoxyqueuosine reductase